MGIQSISWCFFGHFLSCKVTNGNYRPCLYLVALTVQKGFLGTCASPARGFLNDWPLVGIAAILMSREKPPFLISFLQSIVTTSRSHFAISIPHDNKPQFQCSLLTALTTASLWRSLFSGVLLKGIRNLLLLRISHRDSIKETNQFNNNCKKKSQFFKPKKALGFLREEESALKSNQMLYSFYLSPVWKCQYVWFNTAKYLPMFGRSLTRYYYVKTGP